MALCGNCGTNERVIKPDENGMCGKCHADEWWQWEDFRTEDLGYTLRYVVPKNLKISFPELVWRVFDSEGHLIGSEQKAIKDIFERFKL